MVMEIGEVAPATGPDLKFVGKLETTMKKH